MLTLLCTYLQTILCQYVNGCNCWNCLLEWTWHCKICQQLAGTTSCSENFELKEDIFILLDMPMRLTYDFVVICSTLIALIFGTCLEEMLKGILLDKIWLCDKHILKPGYFSTPGVILIHILFFEWPEWQCSWNKVYSVNIQAYCMVKWGYCIGEITVTCDWTQYLCWWVE